MDDILSDDTPNVEVHHHAEPVAVLVGGERVEGGAWVVVSMEHSCDTPYAGLRSQVPDPELRGSRLERWVAIASHERCMMIHACWSGRLGGEAIVECYPAPMAVFAALQRLDGGTDYQTVRALSLCDILETRLLFRGVPSRIVERAEREVPPFRPFEAPELYPAVLETHASGLSSVGEVLVGCLDLEAVEAVGISLSREELDPHTEDTSDTIRLRVVVSGAQRPSRLVHRIAIDVMRDDISVDKISGSVELERFAAVTGDDPPPFRLEHLWLCDSALAIDEVLRREAPGYRMGPTPLRRPIGLEFREFGWAQQFFADWLESLTDWVPAPVRPWR